MQLNNSYPLVVNVLLAVVQNHYRLEEAKVRRFMIVSPCFIHIMPQLKVMTEQMLKAGERAAEKHVPDHLTFIDQYLTKGLPPNLIVVLDTHSDSFSGLLQCAGGLGGVAEARPLPEIARMYVGDAVLAKMQQVSQVARKWNETIEVGSGATPWADLTPRTRGGWRVMVMVACGSAIKQRLHWEYIQQLVTGYVVVPSHDTNDLSIFRDVFDLVLGFGASETLPVHVQAFVNAVVQTIAIHGMKDIWATIQEALIENPSTVKQNSVIAIYKTSDAVIARQVAMHHQQRPFGYEFLGCGTLACVSGGRPGHIQAEMKRGRIRVRCKGCSWRSGWVESNKQDFFRPLHRSRAPYIYYHTFPSPVGLRDLFINAA